MSKGKNSDYNDVLNALNSSKNPVVIGHVNPDGDAYGACGAIALYLESKGKEVAVYHETPLLDRYAFIPFASKVTNTRPDKCDLIVVCDCGDRKRVGDSVVALLDEKIQIINIDHHVSNNFFGDLNIVLPERSSTCEIIYELFTETKTKISPEIATALLIGIVFDTGSFRYRSASADTLRAAADLMDSGADLQAVSTELFASRSLAAMRLEADAVSRMELHCDSRLAAVIVDEEHFKKCNATNDDADNLVDLIRDVKGVEVAAVLRKTDGLWRVSLRSKVDGYDLSEVASRFGGGGHKAAAAFRNRHPIEELYPELIKRLSALFS